MATTPTGQSYTLPTVMWRMQRRNAIMHAVIGLQPEGVIFAWFLNDRPMGVRRFEDCTSALQWSDQMQAQSWAVGWRYVPDGDETTSSGGRTRHP